MSRGADRFEVVGGVVVVHSRWIHYKDLLFTELDAHVDGLQVLLTAHSSKVALRVPELGGLAYRCEALTPGTYEDAKKWKCAYRLFVRLMELRPIVLIVSGWYDVVSWSAWLWGVIYAERMILWSESNRFDRKRVWWKERVKSLFVKRFDLVHVYGQSNGDYIAALGVKPERIITMRAVLDVAHFRLPDAPVAKDGPIRLLYVGRFSPEKNLTTLIEAVASNEAADIELALIGYGPQEAELRRLVERLGVVRRVEFMGKVEQQKLPEEYWRADVFILPSISEAWGLVVNEAMCCGLPVAISTRCGCAADLVTPETGWTFDPLDKPQMTGVIRTIAETDRTQLRKMGLAARKIAELYSPENCAQIVAESLVAVRREV